MCLLRTENAMRMESLPPRLESPGSKIYMQALSSLVNEQVFFRLTLLVFSLLFPDYWFCNTIRSHKR